MVRVAGEADAFVVGDALDDAVEIVLGGLEVDEPDA